MEDGSFGDGGGDGEDELPGEDPVPAPPSKPTRITPCMIAESAGIVSADGARLPADDVATQVVKLTRLRLDRRNIADMDGLECCEGATHVFLQHNRIDKIDGVMFLKALQFLSLDHNQIETVEGLSRLPALNYLGIAHNRIEHAEPGDFPASLRFLDLYGNPCSLALDYRQELTSALTGLIELDQIELERYASSDTGEEEEGGEEGGEEVEPHAGSSVDAQAAISRLHIDQLRIGSADVQAALGGTREKKVAILARAKERRHEMRDLKHIAL